MERCRKDVEHLHVLVVLRGLKDNELAVKKREPVLASAVMAGKVERAETSGLERREEEDSQPTKQMFSIGFLSTSRSPAKRRWDRTGAGDGAADKQADHELSRQVCVNQEAAKRWMSMRWLTT